MEKNDSSFLVSSDFKKERNSKQMTADFEFRVRKLYSLIC